MIIWLVGKNRGGEHLNCVWDILGIFTSKELARKACTAREDFLAPLEVDKRLPDETTEWPGVEYPNLEGKHGQS